MSPFQPKSPAAAAATGAAGDISSPTLGQQIHAPFVLTLLDEREAKNKNKFRLVEITNESGRIRSRIWQDKPAFAMLDDVKPGDPLMITGRIEEGFPAGTLEISVQGVEPLPAPHPVQDHMNPVYPGDVEALIAEFESFRDQIKHPGYRLFFDRFFETACPKERFFKAPAALGNHHAYLHGLLEHSLEVVRTMTSFAQGPDVQDALNRDLLIVGGMIHDGGKIFEYVWEGVPLAMNDDSLLFGHITTGPLMVQQVRERHGAELEAAGFTRQDAKYLIHMIVSHHGNPEWGSPVRPAMPAAELLHQADMMSSRVRKAVQFTRDYSIDENGRVEGSGRGDYWRGLYTDPKPWDPDNHPVVPEPAVNADAPVVADAPATTTGLEAELAEQEAKDEDRVEALLRSLPGKLEDQVAEPTKKAPAKKRSASGPKR